MSIVNTGAVYFRIVAFSYIPMAVSNIFSSWLRCREHATIPFLASFGAVAVNTGLNYLLIFGKLGLPCMGIKGASDKMWSLPVYGHLGTSNLAAYTLTCPIQGLIVFALYAPIKVENMILGGGIIRSGGNTKIIMVIDIVGTWCIGIPLCLLAAYVFKWGIVGVYTLLTTEEIFRLVVSLVIFKRRKWMISLS